MRHKKNTNFFDEYLTAEGFLQVGEIVVEIKQQKTKLWDWTQKKD